MKKLLLSVFILAIVLVPAGAALAAGTFDSSNAIGSGLIQVEDGLDENLGNNPLIETITSIIKIALGLLGLVAVVIILIGGFRWMTAAGREDQIDSAKQTIFAGIIGLAIIMSAWALATFVIGSLSQATGSGQVDGYTAG